MKQRLLWIDAVKGIAIFLMVMGHVIACFFTNWEVVWRDNHESLFWWRFIYSFHMPLLFFISGFLFMSNELKNGNLIITWLHKSKPLVLPFVLMGGIRYLIMGATDSYWFLRTLFFYITCWLVFYGLRRKFGFSMKSDVVFLIISLLLLHISIPNRLEKNPILQHLFDLSHFFDCWLYFSIGVLTREYRLLEKTNRVVFSVMALFVLFYFFLFGVEAQNLVNADMWGRLIQAWYVICVIYLVCYICKERISNGLVTTILTYLGRHTLEIYLIHVFFLVNIPVIGNIILQYSSSGNVRYIMMGQTIELMIAIVLSIINIIMCTIVYEPLKALPVLYECFLGRKVVLHDKTLQ